MFSEEARNKLRENIKDFLENDESLERIPIDNEKQVLRFVNIFKKYISEYGYEKY